MYMREKPGRSASFVILLIVYILSYAFGFLVFDNVTGYFWLRILIADVLATVFVFIFSCIFGNASVYDPYWSVQPIFILAPILFKAPTMPKILLFIMVLFWGTRLSANWAYTFHGLDHQDWRYSQFKEQTGKFYFLVNFAGIHMFPTLVVYACILPAIFVMQEGPAFNPVCLMGFVISIGAACLQLAANIQMQRYRKDRKTPFIEIGLWKHARHPNYLGEILMWWGVAFYAIALMGFRWYFILGAAINNLMFLFISIPMADKRQAKKPGYEEYRKGKNMLIPIRFR